MHSKKKQVAVEYRHLLMKYQLFLELCHLDGYYGTFITLVA